MKKGMIISAVLLIFFIQIISAANVAVRSDYVTAQYPPGAKITGLINLNFTNISSTAYISSSLGQNISLIDLIKIQSKFNYSCTTSDCNSSYVVTGSEEDSKQIDIGSGDSLVFGFPIDGQITSASSENKFSFNLTSNSPSSFLPQLSIDLLNDGFPEWTSYQPEGIFGGESYGCYNPGDYTGDLVTVPGDKPLCEKIFLSVSPDVNLGAVLTLATPGTNHMQMIIKDKDNNYAAGACNVDISASGKISCIPKIGSLNYSIKQSGDFFVCIKKSSGTGSYNVRAEHTSSSFSGSRCGFYGTPPQTSYLADYEIFASSDRFDNIGSFVFNSAETSKSWYQVSNLESQISGYLLNKYANNCTNGCIIPISFSAGIDQQISLSGINLIIPTNIGSRTFNKISDVEETFALISTKGYQNLSLDAANFSVPDSFGNHSFKLTLIDGSNSYNLLSKSINIEKIPQIVSVSPTSTAGALPTEFTANVNTFGSSANITQYKWDFGDGSPVQTTTAKTASHTYSQINTFILQITVYNSQGLSSTAQFSINVGSPRDAVNETLKKNFESVANIENQMQNYPKFAQDAMKQTLNLENTRTQLQTLRDSSMTAVTDEEFLRIMGQLVQVNLPNSIEQTSTTVSAPFFPVASNINLEILKRIGGGNYDSSRAGEYADSIIFWDLNNVQLTTIDHSEFSGIYGDSVNPILNTVSLNVGGTTAGKAYLIIPQLENLYLDKNYSKLGDFYYIPLTGSSQTVEFATSESLSPVNLPVFLAPSLDQITLAGGETSDNKMLIFIIVMGSVILVGILAYILVGKWYQKRYESYLFKDKNDLYNIINYVHGLKNRGIKEAEIEKNLKKAKWNAEQIKYVIKRYAGKKVGIPGFLRRTKVKQ